MPDSKPALREGDPSEQITVTLQRFVAEALVNVSKDSDHAQKYFAHLALDRVREALALASPDQESERGPG